MIVTFDYWGNTSLIKFVMFLVESITSFKSFSQMTCGELSPVQNITSGLITSLMYSSMALNVFGGMSHLYDPHSPAFLSFSVGNPCFYRQHRKSLHS